MPWPPLSTCGRSALDLSGEHAGGEQPARRCDTETVEITQEQIKKPKNSNVALPNGIKRAEENSQTTPLNIHFGILKIRQR